MTTGQPIRLPSDRNKYDNEFMENLRLQIKLNDQNLQANRLYLSTGQLPPSTQMADTRTTAEKLADIEGLKRSIVEDLSPIAETSFAYAIIEGVLNSPLNVNNTLFIYLAQNAPVFAQQLSKKYKFGISGDANDVAIIVNFLEDAYSQTSDKFQNIKNFINSSTNINNNASLQDLLIKEFSDWSFKLDEIQRKAPIKFALTIQESDNIRRIKEIISTIRFYLPTSQQMETILKENSYFNMDIQRQQELNLTGFPNIDPNAGNPRRQDVIRGMIECTRTLPSIPRVKTLINIINKSIQQGSLQSLNDGIRNLTDLFQDWIIPANGILTPVQQDVRDFRQMFLAPLAAETNERNRVAEINTIQTINAERNARDQALKAQRVYVINPNDDPVNVNQIVGQVQQGQLAQQAPLQNQQNPNQGPIQQPNIGQIQQPQSGQVLQAPNPTFNNITQGSSSNTPQDIQDVLVDHFNNIQMMENRGDLTNAEKLQLENEMRTAFRNAILNPFTTANSLNKNLDDVGRNFMAGRRNKSSSSSSSSSTSSTILTPSSSSSSSSLPSTILIPPNSPSSSSDFPKVYTPTNNPLAISQVRDKYYTEVENLERSGQITSEEVNKIKKFINKDYDNAVKKHIPSDEYDDTLSEKINKIKQLLNKNGGKSNKKKTEESSGISISPAPDVMQSRDYFIGHKVANMTPEEVKTLYKHLFITDPGEKLPRTVEMQNELITQLQSIPEDQYDPRTKQGIYYGIGGLGITKKPKKGRGISSDYRDFGINKINHKKLNDGILTIRRKSNVNIPDMPSKRISRKLQKIITHISGGGVPDFNDINNLDDSEKDYLHKLISKSNLNDRLSVPAPSKDQEEKDYHQFEVMKGEIMSGNDSKELIKKFKALILKLSKQKVLPVTEVNELLHDLLALGY